jgi:hypothetical protein
VTNAALPHVLAFALAFGLAVPGAAVRPAAAQAARADVGEILFEGEHFTATAPDALLRYSYTRTSKDAERTRPSFSDVIELRLEPGESLAKRNVVVTLFKGPMHRAAGPFDGVSFNPVVILMLEYHLGDFAKILGGNPRYFKNAIRAGMRDAATSEAVELSLGGRTVPATRITMKPYAADPQRARFGVFADTVYSFTVADAVPGRIAEIRIVTPDPAGGDPVLEEVTRYVDN